MKWAGIAYALVIALLSTPAGAQNEGFPNSADRVHGRVSGRRWHGRQHAVARETSRTLSGDRIIVNNRTGGAGMVGH